LFSCPEYVLITNHWNTVAPSAQSRNRLAPIPLARKSLKASASRPLCLRFPSSSSSPQQNAVDEGADDLIEAPQVEADDRAGNDDNDDALERLASARPVDLPELGGRLADELPARL